MKIILQNTRASLSRRKELQSKINTLLKEYNDVPILVAHKILFKDSSDDIMFDFTTGELKKQVHIVSLCSFEGKKNFKI